jgi:hypothetical protein
MVKSLIYAICIYLFAIKALAADPTFTRLEPDWVKYNAVRVVNNYDSTLLNDLQSHLPAGHPYGDNDKVTSGHECTHGINSYIRLKYAGQGRINALYFLNDRAVILIEPHTTLATVAIYVPQSLRGNMYQTYLIGMQGSWNNESLYIFDEWISYTNGTAVGLDLAKAGKWGGGKRSDTVQFMMEFNVLSLCLAQVIVNVENPGVLYDDTSNFKAVLRWNLRRAVNLSKEAKKYPEFSGTGADAYMERLRTAQDAKGLRDFCKKYFDPTWTKMVLGF